MSLTRNNTSYPMRVTAKLRALHDEYLARLAAGDPIASMLKYYQYLVRAVMSDPEYGIGADGNARGVLVYHTMGMGKTRLAVAVAMALWDVRQPVVLLARGLQKNFRETVAGTVAALNPALDGDELRRLQDAAVARFAFVTMDAYNAADQMARVGTGGVKSAFAATGGLDNKLLIVDEAHNFFRAIINSSAENANARRIYDMAMVARNLRIVFCTGTPASKNPFELVPCFNMLAGFELLPTQYNTFFSLYVDSERHAVRNREKLANRLVGLVSHVTHLRPSSVGSDAAPAAQPRDDGWFPEELPTIVDSVEMGPGQYRAYLLAREKEAAEGKGSGSGTGAGASSSVAAPPALALPGTEKRAVSSYYVRSRSLATFWGGPDWAGKPVADMPDEVFSAENGPKLALIAERTDRAPGPVLIYSQFVDSSGLNPAARYLRRLGYAPYSSGPSSDGPARGHYAIISGEVEPAERDRIKEAFNSPANIRGAVIKAILVSKTGAEGLDLKYLRETHQVEPYWDRARNDQVKARAVRMGCLDALPREDRTVQPYLYVAAANRGVWELMPERDREPATIDEVFRERAERMWRINQAFRDVLAEVCLECEAFGYGRCRTCAPTNAPLYTDDAVRDVRLADPCRARIAEDVTVTELELDGVKYYYRQDAASATGYTFYEMRTDLGGYAVVDPASPVIVALLKLAMKS